MRVIADFDWLSVQRELSHRLRVPLSPGRPGTLQTEVSFKVLRVPVPP